MFRNVPIKATLRSQRSVRLQSRHGFTLVELLVVISIISLLIAVLLPALGKSREISRTTVCSTQVRGFMSGAYNYANDFKSVLPSSTAGLIPTVSTQWYGSDTNTLQINWGIPGTRTGYWPVSLGLLECYLGNYKIDITGVNNGKASTPMPIECVCPEDYATAKTRNIIAGDGWSYANIMTSYYNFMGRNKYDATSLDNAKLDKFSWRDRTKIDVDKPSKMAAVMCDWFHGLTDSTLNLTGSGRDYIGEYAPIAFIDGHVKTGVLKTYMVKAVQPGGAIVWQTPPLPSQLYGLQAINGGVNGTDLIDGFGQ